MEPIETGILNSVLEFRGRMETSGRLQDVEVADVTQSINFYRVYDEPATPRVEQSDANGHERVFAFFDKNGSMLIILKPYLVRTDFSSLNRFAQLDDELVIDDPSYGILVENGSVVPIVLAEAGNAARQHPYFVTKLEIDFNNMVAVDLAKKLVDQVQGILDSGNAPMINDQIVLTKPKSDSVTFRGSN